MLVAANIAWTGSQLVWRSFFGLMDVALPPEEIVSIRVPATLPLKFYAFSCHAITALFVFFSGATGAGGVATWNPGMAGGFALGKVELEGVPSG